VDISKDYFHKNKSHQQQATNVLESLYNKGAIPLLTWHHIEELLAHRNDKIVSNSIQLLQELPIVASLICCSAPYHIGSIVDIETVEFNIILDNKNISLKSITEKTRNDIFDFCSGEDLLYPYIPQLETLRRAVFAKENRKKEIASISRAQSIKPQDPKLSTLRKDKLRSLESASGILNKMQTKLEEEICQKGDKKINSPEKTANEFFKSVLKSGESMYTSSGSTEKRFLKEFGIKIEETKDFKTLDQILYLAIFKKRREVISRNFPDNKKNGIIGIKEKNCPTWLLWKELHKIRTKAERASGSDLNDGYLAGLVYYADLTIVDKRTNEFLTQIERKNKLLKSMINKYEKLSHYSQILNYLPEQ